jgi:hypothetical protein
MKTNTHQFAPPVVKGVLATAVAMCLYAPFAAADNFELYDCVVNAQPEAMCEIKDHNDVTLLKVEQKDFTVISTESFSVDGDAYIPGAVFAGESADLRLSSVEIEVRYVDGEISVLAGQAALPIDQLSHRLPVDAFAAIPASPFDKLTEQELVMVDLGYSDGKDIKRLGAHATEGKKYLYFRSQAAPGFEESQGDISFGAGVDGGYTMVIEPNDPYFYLGVTPPGAGAGIDISSSDEEDDSQDWGIGASYEAQIPYSPDVELAQGQDLSAFNGSHVVDGIIPIPPLAMEFDGSLTFQLPGSDFQQTLNAISSGQFQHLPRNVMVGGNGGISLGFDAFGPVGVSLDIGSASLGIISANNADENALSVFFSGEMEAGQWEVFDDIPFSPAQATLNVSALFGFDDLSENARPNSDSHFRAEGMYGLHSAAVEKLLGFGIGNLQQIKGVTEISKEGFYLKGVSLSQPNIPFVKFNKEVDVEITVPASDPEDFILLLKGDMTLNAGGVEISNMGEVEISSSGAYMKITYDSLLNDVEVVGLINRSDFLLYGNTEFILPLSLINHAKASVNTLDDAKREVAKINNEIKRQRAIVAAERKRASAGLEKAKRKVREAEKKLTRINRWINDRYRWIRGHKNALASKKRWARNCSWWKSGWCWARYGAEAGWRGAKIAAHYAYIGGMRGAKQVAKGGLWIARQSLEGARQAVVYTPVDMDPRVSGLFAGRETALLALEAAKQTLNAMPNINADVGGDVALQISNKGVAGDIAAKYCTARGCEDVAGARLIFTDSPEACITIPVIGEQCIRI